MGIYEFIVFGLLGISLEVMFTGIKNFFKGNKFGEGYSFVLMFPVYGFWGIVFNSMWNLIGSFNFFIRGVIYVLGFFLIEYLSGFFYRKLLGESPWIYKNKWNIHGLIRLDFIPVWFVVGLFFEYVSRNLI